MNSRRIIKNEAIEILPLGHKLVLASVKKDLFSPAWKITMFRATESGMPAYEFTRTRREAIERMKYIYRVEG